MIFDVALHLEREERLTGEKAVRQASHQRLRSPGRRAHDLHEWRRIGISPASGLCHRRRIDRVASPHPVHHTGGLHLPRSAAAPPAGSRGLGRDRHSPMVTIWRRLKGG